MKSALEAGRPALLVLVRHGESERNLAKKGQTYFADEEARARVKGIPDHKIALTELGVEQARQTGIALRKRFDSFDYGYHSGYLRTAGTLAGLLQAYTEEELSRTKVRMNQFIRERDPGHTYDMTKAQAETHFPYLEDYWKTEGGYFAAPPGGESLAQVTDRLYQFVNMLFRDRAGQKVLVATHGGTLRCLRFILERWDYDKATKWPPGQSPKNCGVTVYEYDPKVERLVLREYNTVLWKP